MFQDAVLEELHLYDSDLQAPNHYGLNFRGKASHFWWPGSATAREVFDVGNN